MYRVNYLAIPEWMLFWGMRTQTTYNIAEFGAAARILCPSAWYDVHVIFSINNL